MSENLEAIIKGFTSDRSNLVSMLFRIQEAEKRLTPQAISAISRYLDLTENYTYSVASFYKGLCIKTENN